MAARGSRAGGAGLILNGRTWSEFPGGASVEVREPEPTRLAPLRAPARARRNARLLERGTFLANMEESGGERVSEREMVVGWHNVEMLQAANEQLRERIHALEKEFAAWRDASLREEARLRSLLAEGKR